MKRTKETKITKLESNHFVSFAVVVVFVFVLATLHYDIPE
jgi:hypothetical protein